MGHIVKFRLGRNRMIEWTSVFLHNIGKFGISPLCSLPINSCHSLPQEKTVTYWFIWTLSYYSSEQLFMQQSQVLATDSSTHAHVYLGSAPKQGNCCIGGVACSAKDIQKYIRYLTEKIGLYFFCLYVRIIYLKQATSTKRSKSQKKKAWQSQVLTSTHHSEKEKAASLDRHLLLLSWFLTKSSRMNTDCRQRAAFWEYSLS